MRAFNRFTLYAVGLLGALTVVAFAPAPLHADQIQMQNGDHYAGTVLTLNSETLLLQSDVLGTVRLPRAKVALITFGSAAPDALPVLPSPSNVLAQAAIRPPATNNAPALTGSMRQLGTNGALIHQIQTQYLEAAGPEAKDKFNELLGGFLTGRLSVQDIRAQAQATAAQVRAMRNEMGDDAGGMLDTYLAILDRFVKEAAPASESTPKNASPPNSKPSSSKPAPPAEAD